MVLKVGFIGTGGIAQSHLRNLADIDDVTVTAFCDIQLERAERAAKEWSDARAYSKMTDMLDDQTLDAVYVCIPPMAHGEAENQLVERGMPFSVEKPLGIIPETPRDILKKIEHKKIITSVGYQWRYNDATKKARELLQGHTLGMAVGYWMGGLPSVPWWRVQDGSGGQFVEQTTHITDLLRYLCGEVVEVYAAYGHRTIHEEWENATVADVGSVVMKLDNGSVATISNSCMLSGGGKVGLDIFTDEGSLEIRGNGLTNRTKNETTEYNSTTNPKYSEDLAFTNAVRTGDPSGILSDYADAVKTHEVTMAANESAATGKPVRLLHNNKDEK